LFCAEEAGLGCAIVDMADQDAGVIDVLAECFGYTIDEVTEPFWQQLTA
jgi:hypothetical protein